MPPVFCRVTTLSVLALCCAERLSAHAQGVTPGISDLAANCIDEAWADMSIVAPAEGSVTVLGTTFEVVAEFPSCAAIAGVFASIKIRYRGKTTKLVEHGQSVLAVRCELISERCDDGFTVGHVQVACKHLPSRIADYSLSMLVGCVSADFTWLSHTSRQQTYDDHVRGWPF